MNPITDDDLLLLYYGEHDDPELPVRVATDAALSERFEQLGQELALLDQLEVPDPGVEFGARTWQKIVPRLAASPPPRGERWIDRLHWLRPSLAGALAMLIVATASFWLGRQAEPVGPPRHDASRVLEMRVAAHLAEADLLLTHVANGERAGARESELAAALLVSNRIYRRAALTAGRGAMGELLSDLERPLLELANDPTLGVNVNDSLLFQVRVQAQMAARTNRTTANSKEI